MARWREQGRREVLADQQAEDVPTEENWQNPKVEFNPSARSLTPAQRKEILRRDRHCCTAPCCSNWMWLQIHHRKAFALGGLTLPENLCTVCTGCHHNLHHGYLFVVDDDSGGLLWKDSSGRELGTSPPQPLEVFPNVAIGEKQAA